MIVSGLAQRKGALMGKLLWEPSDEIVENANMTRFISFVNEKYGLKIDSYWQLYDWSVDKVADFWAAVWDFVDIKASQGYEEVVDDLNKFPGARWFIGAKLNFAENLLRYRDDSVAFIFRGETMVESQMTYRELYDKVARLARSLRQMGVKPGDRVCAYMPNMIETAIAMLAATSAGAIWSSCATDLGAPAALDRIGQIKPKVLFTASGYYYKGNTFKTLEKAAEVAKEAVATGKSLREVILEKDLL